MCGDIRVWAEVMEEGVKGREVGLEGVNIVLLSWEVVGK